MNVDYVEEEVDEVKKDVEMRKLAEKEEKVDEMYLEKGEKEEEVQENEVEI